MYTDPIADFLTRIRNAQAARKQIVEAPASNLKAEIARVLQDQGYIRRYKVVEEGEGPGKVIKVALKYDKITKQPAISELKRFSRPGLRQYRSADTMPRVMSGLGVAIISTSKGVMTDKEARRQNVGGEVLCTVF